MSSASTIVGRLPRGETAWTKLTIATAAGRSGRTLTFLHPTPRRASKFGYVGHVPTVDLDGRGTEAALDVGPPSYGSEQAGSIVPKPGMTGSALWDVTNINQRA
jgi:hypothetical protein